MVMMFYPEQRTSAFTALDNATTTASIISTPMSNTVMDERVMAVCKFCSNQIVHMTSHDSRIPKDIFEINNTLKTYIIYRVVTPKMINNIEQFAGNSFFNIYKILRKIPQTNKVKSNIQYKYELEQINTIDNQYNIFWFDNEGGQFDSYMFALYSQTNMLHYCLFKNLEVVRNSELHRNATVIRLLKSKKFKFHFKNIIQLIIYSYSEDLYLKFPQNDFFKSVTNDSYVLCLKKSTSDNFNYIYTNEISLSGVEIFGEYQVRHVAIGKAQKTEPVYDIDQLIFPTGSAVLHALPEHKQFSVIKRKYKNPRKEETNKTDKLLTAHNAMDYAIFKHCRLYEKAEKPINNKISRKRNQE